MIEHEVIGKVPEFPTEMERFLEDACEYTYQSVVRNFIAGGRPSPWTPIRKTGAPSHLVETGRLLSSIRKEVGDEYCRVYTPGGAVPYAFAHQFGYAPNNLVPRPFMVWQDEDKMAIAQMFRGWLIAYIQTHKKDVHAKT